MRNLQTMLGAGVAATAIGFAGIAAAQSPQIHTMTLALPGGGVEQIRYIGRAAPQVAVSDATVPVFPAMPMFGAGPPFAELERISAAMDRQADQMFREAAVLQAGAAQPDLTAISAAMPAGSRAYSFVAQMNGGNVCSRSMVITSRGNGAAPHVETRTSGNCGTVGAPGLPTPTQLPTAPAPSNGPRMIMTKATGAHPYVGRIEEASLK